LDILQWLVEVLRAALGSLVEKPYVVITVLLLCVFIQLMTSLVYRKLTDVKKLMRYQKEIAEWQSQYMRAVKSNDRKALEKLNRRKRRIEQLQMEVFKATMKAWIVLFFPLLALWNLFNRVIATNQVAYLPLLGRWLDFNAWYFIAILAISFIFQRFLGIRTRG